MEGMRENRYEEGRGLDGRIERSKEAEEGSDDGETRDRLDGSEGIGGGSRGIDGSRGGGEVGESRDRWRRVMVKTSNYRITCALDKSILLTSNKESTIRIKLINAIEIHRRTFEFFEYFTCTFSLSYFILVILGVASLSINLFRLFQVATLPDQKKDVNVIDSSTKIFRKAMSIEYLYNIMCCLGTSVQVKAPGATAAAAKASQSRRRRQPPPNSLPLA
ncbi:PREDICTED: uncharacterized protein LOC105557708 [Vollenhovia emeryi]|uniref:uncharacterized protein LOC105557708 n=1 Tax=Vollenhovia emeryi TaxID=411798 RepID=UPI0005F48985|nr:PREDICTED: uncharacterized protein LOC105557708 [Vollenhovia emeryi]